MGGSYGQAYDDFDQKYLHNYRNPSAQPTKILFSKLESGELDYLVYGYFDGLAHLASLGMGEKVIALEKPVTSNPVYFLFSRESACSYLLPKIDSIIEKKRTEGKIDDLIKNYLKRR